MHSCGAIGMATTQSASNAAAIGWSNSAWSAGSCANGVLSPRVWRADLDPQSDPSRGPDYTP